MRVSAEFRISARKAHGRLPRGLGESVGYGVLRVQVPADSEVFREIGRIDAAMREEGSCFFTGWWIVREYSNAELQRATRFHIWPRRTFEPCGEECGTVYDDSTACPECGSGGQVVHPFRLDVRKIPTGVHLAYTIADELVISASCVRAFRDAGLTGYEAVPIAGVDAVHSRDWFYARITGSPVTLLEETKFGETPFDLTATGKCSRGDLLGLNLLSEVHFDSASDHGADLVRSSQWVGVRRGLLRPRNLILASPRALEVVREFRPRAVHFEIARSAW